MEELLHEYLHFFSHLCVQKIGQPLVTSEAI
jgi:hypothetical protein